MQGKPEWAYKLAKQAVNCAPSEFVTWSKLTEVNIELRNYNDALLTLNSCPMFTYNERDLHRMPTPSRTHLPLKAFIHESGILASLEGQDGDNNEADVNLLRLPAPNLKGTWKKAYELLARLVSQIGWDELLKARSEVFVMEEEYRMQKQEQEQSGTSQPGTATESADDDASIRAMRESGPRQVNGNGNRAPSRSDMHPLSPALNGAADAPRSPEPPASPIPEIRISHHAGNSPPSKFSQLPPEEPAGSSAEEPAAAAEAQPSDMAASAPGVDKPPVSHLSETHDVKDDQSAKEAVGGAERSMLDGARDASSETAVDGQQESGPAASFTNKRLCERWLDNLFMVLYEVRQNVHKVSGNVSLRIRL